MLRIVLQPPLIGSAPYVAAIALLGGLRSPVIAQTPTLTRLTPTNSWYSTVDGVTAAGDVIYSSEVQGRPAALRWRQGVGSSNLIPPSGEAFDVRVRNVTPSGFIAATSNWQRSGPCCNTWGEACDLIGTQALIIDAAGNFKLVGDGLLDALCSSEMELCSDDGIHAIAASTRICPQYPEPGCEPGRYLWSGPGPSEPLGPLPQVYAASGNGEVWATSGSLWYRAGQTVNIDFGVVAINFDGTEMIVNRIDGPAIWRGGDQFDPIDTDGIERASVVAVSGNWQWFVLGGAGGLYIKHLAGPATPFMEILQGECGLDPGVLVGDAGRVCGLGVRGVSNDGMIIAGDASEESGYGVGYVLNRNGENANPWCPADFDDSGFVDTDDFDAFVLAFEAGDINADVDYSCFVDTEDFDWFVVHFERGC